MNVEVANQLNIRGSPTVDGVNAPKPTRPSELSESAAVSEVAQERPGAPESEEFAPQEVEQALEGMNSFLEATGNQLQFALHEGSDQIMVKVIDRQTHEVIKTIPSQELLDLQAKIGELVGTLVDEKG